jgi:hypothetical protein
VVEVEREEHPAALGLRQQHVRLGQVEDERLLDEQRHAPLQQVQGRGEVLLVGQAHADEVGLLGVEHLVEVGVGASTVRVGARPRAFLAAADDGAQVRVGPAREHAGVLLPPATGADDRDAQRVRRADLTNDHGTLLGAVGRHPLTLPASRPRTK